uniref:Uncharacterized protein n=1 Tax=Mus musculus TaxID=10090 RepID=A0ABJ3HP78_MOUSE
MFAMSTVAGMPQYFGYQCIGLHSNRIYQRRTS